MTVKYSTKSGKAEKATSRSHILIAFLELN